MRPTPISGNIASIFNSLRWFSMARTPSCFRIVLSTARYGSRRSGGLERSPSSLWSTPRRTTTGLRTSASAPPGRSTTKRGKQSASHLVDLSKPPHHHGRDADEMRKRLAAVARTSDSEIDFSDIPGLTDDFFKKAIRKSFSKPTSSAVRIDSDVLHWLRAQGRGYQSRVDAIPPARSLPRLNPALGSSQTLIRKPRNQRKLLPNASTPRRLFS